MIDEAFDAGLIDEFYTTVVRVWGRDSDVMNCPESAAMGDFEIESTADYTSVTGVGYYIAHYVW